MRPDHAVALVADDHRDVRMAFAVAGPVHADRRQPVERRRHRRPEPISDPAGDVARGAPRHVQEPADGLPVRDAHQPRALRLEIPREPVARFRPRHPGDHDAAFRTIHARHRGDQSDPPAAEILMTPATHAAALAVTVASPATHLRAPGLFISETRILVRINKKHPGRSSASAGAFVTVCPIE